MRENKDDRVIKSDLNKLPIKLSQHTLVVIILCISAIAFFNFMADSSDFDFITNAYTALNNYSNTEIDSVTKQMGNSASGQIPGVQTASSDNEKMARAAVAYAYMTQVTHDNGTQLYRKLHDTFFPGDSWYQACDRSVATAVHWVGADLSLPRGRTNNQMSHFLHHSDIWKPVEGWAPNTTYGAVGDPSVLQPGDILIASNRYSGDNPINIPIARDGHNHILMYVGYDVVKAVKGESEVNSHGYTPDMVLTVSGSVGTNSRPPGIGKMSTSEYKFNAFRCINQSFDTRNQSLEGGIP